MTFNPDHPDLHPIKLAEHFGQLLERRRIRREQWRPLRELRRLAKASGDGTCLADAIRALDAATKGLEIK